LGYRLGDPSRIVITLWVLTQIRYLWMTTIKLTSCHGHEEVAGLSLEHSTGIEKK
jgi:hypothetical protein